MNKPSAKLYDYVIIGSGFGGSVSALRLVEKGYRVLLLEKGRELQSKDFPTTNWQFHRWLWIPTIGFRGLFQMRFFRHITAMAGVGVGGGSLVYANTPPIPPDDFFQHPAWSSLANWKSELMPHYSTARQMLGASQPPFMTEPDRLLRKLALDRGHPENFEQPLTAVHYGQPGVEVQDPYFGGDGPTRTGCIRCGACMTGCRHHAKNTLDKNYLYLARKQGLRLLANSEVRWVRPHPSGGYEIKYQTSVSTWKRKKYSIRATNVIFSGGTLGTVDLLLRLRQSAEGLPNLSHTLGTRVRTNSESLIGVTTQRRDHDLSKGVSIGSIYKIDKKTHLEAVRYGAGSGAFRLFVAPHVGGRAPGVIKILLALVWIITHPFRAWKLYSVPDWAKYTMILLYMQAADSTLGMIRRRRWWSFGMRTSMGSCLEDGVPPTASIPQATELANTVAREIDGSTVSLVTETLFNIPSTAHVLGGCCMGQSVENGVVDADHRVFGYPGLFVIDGSAISANPGVNPSLTITALAERAMSKIESKPVNATSNICEK